MKPEGLKHFKFPGKQDCHPKMGYVNWWERICGPASRTRIKRETRKEIDSQLKDFRPDETEQKNM